MRHRASLAPISQLLAATATVAATSSLTTAPGSSLTTPTPSTATASGRQSTPGFVAYAKDDGSACFKFCCEGATHADGTGRQHEDVAYLKETVLPAANKTQATERLDTGPAMAAAALLLVGVVGFLYVSTRRRAASGEMM